MNFINYSAFVLYVYEGEAKRKHSSGSEGYWMRRVMGSSFQYVTWGL